MQRIIIGASWLKKKNHEEVKENEEDLCNTFAVLRNTLRNNYAVVFTILAGEPETRATVSG